MYHGGYHMARKPAAPKETYDDLIKNAESLSADKKSSWLIIGLDPSMSRSGISVLTVNKKDEATVHFIGSVQPDDRSVDDFIRAKAQTAVIQNLIMEHADEYDNLLVSLEAPTPGNDYLISTNRIMKTGISARSITKKFDRVIFMHTNASTLRSCFGLIKKGNNKSENIDAAYSIVKESDYPGIDSDACDALLIGMMGRYAVSVLNSNSNTVPEKFLKALTSQSRYTTTTLAISAMLFTKILPNMLYHGRSLRTTQH